MERRRSIWFNIGWICLTLAWGLPLISLLAVLTWELIYEPLAACVVGIPLLPIALPALVHERLFRRDPGEIGVRLECLLDAQRLQHLGIEKIARLLFARGIVLGGEQTMERRGFRVEHGVDRPEGQSLKWPFATRQKGI